MKRNGVNELSKDEAKDIIDKWKKDELDVVIKELNVKRERIYNGDQTGLYYDKLPNSTYIQHDLKKTIQMM